MAGKKEKDEWAVHGGVVGGLTAECLAGCQ